MKKHALRALAALALLLVLACFLTTCQEPYKPTVTLGIQIIDPITNEEIPDPVTIKYYSSSADAPKNYVRLNITVDAPPAIEVEVKLELSAIKYLQINSSSGYSDVGNRVKASQQYKEIVVEKAQGGFYVSLKTIKASGVEETTITLTATAKPSGVTETTSKTVTVQ
jgi:hypothetical protein